MRGLRTPFTPFTVPAPDPGATLYTGINTNGTAVGATTLYCMELDMPVSKLITGIAVLNGTTVTANARYVILYDAAGRALANSALAGQASVTASVYENYAFTTPFYAVGGSHNGEIDFVESFGYDNGGGSTNFSGTNFYSRHAQGVGLCAGCSSSNTGLRTLGGSTYASLGSAVNTLVTSGNYPNQLPLFFFFDSVWGNPVVGANNDQVYPPGISGSNNIDSTYFPLTYEYSYIRVYMR